MLAVAGCFWTGAYWWWNSVEVDGGLSPERFVPLRINSVERLNAETSLFRLALPARKRDRGEGEGRRGPIESMYLMQPDLQIQRPYTVSWVLGSTLPRAGVF